MILPSKDVNIYMGYDDRFINKFLTQLCNLYLKRQRQLKASNRLP